MVVSRVCQRNAGIVHGRSRGSTNRRGTLRRKSGEQREQHGHAKQTIGPQTAIGTPRGSCLCPSRLAWVRLSKRP